MVGQISIGDRFLIKEIEFIHRRLLAQGDVGNDALACVRLVKDRIQQMGLSFSVPPCNNHAAGSFSVKHILHGFGDPLHYAGPGIAEIPANRT